MSDPTRGNITVSQEAGTPDLRHDHRVKVIHILGSEGLVVHEEEVDIGDVLDEEGFVARRH